MSYQTSIKCKICMSPYRIEIEELKVSEQKTFKEIENILMQKYGYSCSAAAIHRHMKNHFDYETEAIEKVTKASQELYKTNLIDATKRASSLSATLHASHEYIMQHLNELDLKTALQMFFGSVDQLNKMEGTGAFAGSEFLTQFQQLLESVKRGKPEQPEIVFAVKENGEAEEI